jgi:hypothetical protein
MYPYVELNIKDGVPSIIYYPDQNSSRAMTIENESVIEAAIFAGKELGLIDSKAEHTQQNFEELLTIARNSDETFYTEIPNMDVESIEMKLLKTLKPYLQEIKNYNPDNYSGIQMDKNVKEEIERIRMSDSFASYMEGLYTILIAKTLLAANDLGIGNIALNDNNRNPRLMEKMAAELDKLGIELIIPESN